MEDISPPAIPVTLVEFGMLAHLPPGATFIRAGDPVRAAAILLEGSLEESGGRTVAAPGTLVAGAEAMERVAAAASWRVTSETTLLVIAAADLAAAADRRDVRAWLDLQLAPPCRCPR